MIAGLRACGVEARDEGDTLIVEGNGSPPPGGARVAAQHDHRIAMAFLILGLASRAGGGERLRQHDRDQLSRLRRPDAFDRRAARMSWNSFGRVLRFSTWGESHGPAIGAVVDGCPPGLALSEADIQPWLDKRRPGGSRFTTQRREPDAVRILSGTFEGVTTGTPISLMIENVDQRSKDYPKHRRRLSPRPRRLRL